MIWMVRRGRRGLMIRRKKREVGDVWAGGKGKRAGELMGVIIESLGIANGLKFESLYRVGLGGLSRMFVLFDRSKKGERRKYGRRIYDLQMGGLARNCPFRYA